MGSVTRGLRNTFRNPLRTASIVAIVAITFALALSMLIAHQATVQRVAGVTSTLDTTVTVTPANYFDGFGSGSPLSNADVTAITATPHVVSVVSSIMDHLSNVNQPSQSRFGNGGSSTATTSLTSPATSGTLGNHFGFGGAPRVNIVGSNTPLSPALLGSTSVKIVRGVAINGSSSADVADMGTALASKNDLTVGSTFTAYDTTFTVKGIFTTSSPFGNASLVVPLRTEETVSGIDGVTTVVATIDTLADVQPTATAIQDTLGKKVASVTTSESGTATAASELSSIKTITLFSLAGALIAAAAILLMSMLMIVRDRRREIGILKAFGSSNGGVVSSFVAEAFSITLLSAILGTVLGIALSNPILTLLKNSTSSSPSGRGGFGAGGFGPPHFTNFGFGGFTPARIHEVLGTDVALFAVLIAVGIALLGSALPAYAIAKVRPAEVMRSE
jgi:putative ABC transport system permease protein